MLNANHPQKIDLERLKQTINIKDLAERLGLEIRGNQARCFNTSQHKNNDQHFSLGLNIKDNTFKCFACGISGSVIDLYKEVNNVELKDAIRSLADIAGFAPLNYKITANSERATENQSLYKTTVKQSKNSVYNTIYKTLETFCGELDIESENYLKSIKRGLDDKTIKRFRLFCIKDYQQTNKYLKDNFDLQELRQAGVMGEKDNLIFYKNKIVIPFLDNGEIVFLQGRRSDEEHPKYLHIKRPVSLFNIDTLKDLEKGDKVFITEGVFDAMILEQNGYRAVAILGVNNFKPEMIYLFKGLDVVLCLDNDEAGQKATQELAKTFYLKGQQVRSKQLPDGVKDITDYFVK